MNFNSMLDPEVIAVTSQTVIGLGGGVLIANGVFRAAAVVMESFTDANSSEEYQMNLSNHASKSLASFAAGMLVMQNQQEILELMNRVVTHTPQLF